MQNDLQKDFISKFRTLKIYVDDDPDNLYESVFSDQSIRDAVQACMMAYFESSIAEEAEVLDTDYQGTDQNYIAECRSFEDRYYKKCMIASMDFLKKVIDENPAMTNLRDQADQFFTSIVPDLISLASPLALEKYQVIKEGTESNAKTIIEELKASNSWLKGEVNRPPDGYGVDQATGIDILLKFLNDSRFDLSTSFRASALAPKVFLPQHIVSRKHNNRKEILSVYLGQAIRSYTFSAPAAAISLLRALIETILRDHYNAVGSDLSEMISNCKALNWQDRNSLHDLRKLANSILHSSMLDGSSDLSDEDFELKIVGYFNLIRDLIERAPK